MNRTLSLIGHVQPFAGCLKAWFLGWPADHGLGYSPDVWKAMEAAGLVVLRATVMDLTSQRRLPRPITSAGF